MSAPSPEFVAMVKDALEHLYDPGHLRDHPLAQALFATRAPVGASRAQALHQEILAAIQALDPGNQVPADAIQHRAHRVLELRYVEALPFREVMAALGLSQTQYYRDHRHALASLASVLHERAHALGDEIAAAHEGDTLLDLGTVVSEVTSMLRPVADAQRVALVERLPKAPTTMFGDRTTVRQLVISLIGHAIAGATGGEIVVDVAAPDASVGSIAISYTGSIDTARLRSPDERQRVATVEQLAAALSSRLEVSATPTSLLMQVNVPLRQPRLLVIDDNHDVAQLVTRLIASRGYTVLSATSVDAGLQLARDAQPDVILLDIMIPRQDGWDALQLLKHDPAVCDIPVIVCTVLAEPQLAHALGAAEFIRKPLTGPILVAALDHCLAKAPRPAGANRVPSESNAGTR